MAVLKDLIVHGSSRFLNGAQFNTINAESIGATEGIFNKLIATTLEAKEATITDLTAENATVTGLLDVQGQMHTNSWTNANIATIDGNFFITPTIGVAYGAFTYNGTDITVSGVTKDGTTYTFGTDSNWVANSLVMITGQVAGTDAMMPLGTIRGKLKSVSSTDGQCATVVITGPFSDGIGGPCTTLENIGTVSGVDAKDIKISLYQKKIDSGLAPLGIYMTSGGMSTQNMSFIDIYNGGNIVSTAPSDANGSSGAFAKPVLRIGNLSHLGTVGGQTVTGYGIYTTNGFFEGVITAKKGYIGGSDGWTISTTDIHSPSAHSSYNSNNDGIYIGKVSSDYYIAGGPQAQWWLKSDGTAKIGELTLTKVNNVFTLAVPAANITGTLAASQIDVSGVINTGSIVVSSDINDTFVSATILYYASNSTTPPSKPTAHVTTNNANTRGAWNIALPTYNASYPYLYTCIEYKTKNNTYSWTSVEQTSYTTTISNKASINAEYKVEIITSNFDPTATGSNTLVTLTAKVTRVDGTAVGTISYKWYGNTTEISGATSATYNVPANTSYSTFTVEIS